jgi:hypothetical protein
MVIYDHGKSSEGGAGRIFWALEFLGCKQLQILNGGISKWLADGNAIEKRINSLPPLHLFDAQRKKAFILGPSRRTAIFFLLMNSEPLFKTLESNMIRQWSSIAEKNPTSVALIALHGR